jgi:hypothetical protein
MRTFAAGKGRGPAWAGASLPDCGRLSEAAGDIMWGGRATIAKHFIYFIVIKYDPGVYIVLK